MLMPARFVRERSQTPGKKQKDWGPKKMSGGGFAAKRYRMIEPRGFERMMPSKRPRTRVPS